MKRKIKHLKASFVLGTVTFVTLFMGVSIAWLNWIEQIGIQRLLAEYSSYIFGFGGFAATIFLVMQIKFSPVPRNGFKRKYELPSYSINGTKYGRVNYQHDKLSRMILPTKIVNRKTVVLKSRFDHTTIKLLGEKVKGKLFAKRGFLKAKPEEAQLISVDKYCEPYIVVGGKYAVDYCKKSVYTVKVDENPQEVAFLDKKFKPEPLSGPSLGTHKVIKLDGVAHFHYEDEAYYILDVMGREVDPEQMPCAPCEEQTVETLAKDGIKFVEAKISPEEEIEFLRSRIVNMPSDVEEIIREIFEVNERAIFYIPVYQLQFRNVKTGKEAIAKIDGITGKIVLSKFTEHFSIDDFIEAHSGNLLHIEENVVESKPEHLEPLPTKNNANDLEENTTNPNKVMDTHQVSKASEVEGTTEFPTKASREVFHVGDNVTAVVGDLEIPSGTTIFKTLVVKGNLKIGTDCRILGKIKALRDIIIGANTTIEGNVVSGRNVIVGSNSVIHGSVESAGDVEMNENVVIEGGLYSKSSVVLNGFAKIWWTVNAAKGISNGKR